MAMIVKKIRQLNGMTMRDMADKLGISVSYVNEIEKQREPLRENITKRLYDAFSLDAEKLAELERDYEKYRL